MVLADHWDQKHLISFLYLFLASSDFVVTDTETKVVNENLQELLKGRFQMSVKEVEELIVEVKEVESVLNDVQKMEMIQGLSTYINLDWETYQYVVKELDEIAQSDKYVSVEEHSLMYYVRLKFKKDYPQRDKLVQPEIV